MRINSLANVATAIRSMCECVCSSLKLNQRRCMCSLHSNSFRRFYINIYFLSNIQRWLAKSSCKQEEGIEKWNRFSSKHIRIDDYQSWFWCANISKTSERMYGTYFTSGQTCIWCSASDTADHTRNRTTFSFKLDCGLFWFGLVRRRCVCRRIHCHFPPKKQTVCSLHFCSFEQKKNKMRLKQLNL